MAKIKFDPYNFDWDNWKKLFPTLTSAQMKELHNVEFAWEENASDGGRENECDKHRINRRTIESYLPKIKW